MKQYKTRNICGGGGGSDGGGGGGGGVIERGHLHATSNWCPTPHTQSNCSLIIVLGRPIILLQLRDRGQIGDLSSAGCNLYIKHPIHQYRIVRHQQTQTS